MSLVPSARLSILSSHCLSLRMSSFFGDPGAGAGKSGGSGGSIRDAGGAFGKLEAAREDEYFYNLQKTQLKGLKDQIKREIEHHEGQMKNHQEVLERHKKRILELEKDNLFRV